MNDRTTLALQALTPHLLPTIHPLEVRTILDDLQDAAVDETLADLIGATEAAAIWEISRQAANTHIRSLHARYGYGLIIGGVWVIRRAHVLDSPPERKYRPKGA